MSLNKDPEKALTNCEPNLKYVYDAEWFDIECSMIKYFWLGFYPFDGAIDMYDKKSKKVFLHRCFVPEVNQNKLFIGSTLNIFGRLIKITNYASEFTKRSMSHKREKTFALIKPISNNPNVRLSEILNCIIKCGLQITQLRMCQLTETDARRFYEKYKAAPFFPSLIGFVSSAPVIAIELLGENAIEKWKDMVGPLDPMIARRDKPNSLRAAYGLDIPNNIFHASENIEEVERDTKFFFPTDSTSKPPATTTVYENSTLCIIKPHVLLDGTLGNILGEIENGGFTIQAMFSVLLSLVNANEFMEIYQGVLENYGDIILHMASGPCVALEVRSADPEKNVFHEFRKFCGPKDPAIARQIRPNTLRAKYGLNPIYNAVHCTDLEEDCQSDVEYFFKILDNI